MKKFSIVLLALLLAGGFAFAAELTGDADVSFAYNFDSTAYGFANGTSVNVDVNLKEVLVDNAGEGDIYAEIEGTLGLNFSTADEAPAELDPEAPGAFRLYPMFAATIDTAKIVGDNWSVSILGMDSAPDYAVSAIDSYDDPQANNAWNFSVDDAEKFETYKLPFTKTSGVQVSYGDYSIGFGMTGDVNAGTNTTSFSLTGAEIEVADGVAVSAGAVLSSVNGTVSFGGSLKTALTVDAAEISLATDIGYDGSALGADVALNAVYDMITVDAYYGTATQNYTDLLSAKVKADLEDVVVTVTAADLLNTQDFSASAELPVDALTVTAKGGYTLSSSAWNAGGKVVYAADEYKATLDSTYYSTQQLKLKAAVESTTLINGATVSLTYEGKDLLKKVAETNELGSVTAKVKVAL